MFMGEYHHSLDNKGRLIVPARFREELGPRFTVTRGLDNCLFVYATSEWERLTETMRTLPFTKADVRAFTRMFLSGAAELELDKQGRVLLPAYLRKHAGIEKDVVVTGVSSRVEIWSEDKWQAYTETANASYEEIAEKLDDFMLF